MGWSDWFSSNDAAGGEYSEKQDGNTSHTMRTSGGDTKYSGSRADHMHIVVKQGNNGKTSAHSAGYKSQRK